MTVALNDLMDRYQRRDRRALATLLSRVENGESIEPPQQAADPSRVIGITGSGGAGQSTLVAVWIKHLRALQLTVAVLACDPQSPVTGGALLGDRIRVQFDPEDEGVYFRSLSTRGARGGISQAVAPAVELLRGFGFDVVLVETVGVGQDQIDVRRVVETLVLLVTPHTGDEIQWEKAGVLEVADVVVVNKADLPGADRVQAQLEQSLSLGSPSLGSPATVPVVQVVAATGSGIAALWDVVVRLTDRGAKPSRAEPPGTGAAG